MTADGPIQVMSLLQSPTGHLTNLSVSGLREQDGGTTQALDLFVEPISVTNDAPSPGEGFILNATVYNRGVDASPPTTLRYLVSADTAITPSDTQVGTDSVGAVGASSSEAHGIDLKAPLSPGTYYYGACADAVSDERDTSNNCSVGVRVAVSAP